MTVRELIEALSKVDPNMVVRLDLDDYLKVTGVKSAESYDGPTEYTPPSDCVLLAVE